VTFVTLDTGDHWFVHSLKLHHVDRRVKSNNGKNLLMSISSTGILVFGFDLGGEEGALPLPELLGEDETFEDFIADEAGIEPWKEGLGDEYYARKRAAIAACPVDLVIHCSFEYAMWILAIRGTEINAPRGYPQIVKGWDVPQEKIEAARKWCLDYGVEWQEPTWILCSIYG
jgi:hypothetical protein